MALLVFGTDKIPEIARGLAHAMKTVRNASNEIKREIARAAESDETTKDLKETVEEVKTSLSEVAESVKRGA